MSMMRHTVTEKLFFFQDIDNYMTVRNELEAETSRLFFGSKFVSEGSK